MRNVKFISFHVLNIGGKTMINKKIEKALNNQVNAEMYSAYLYLAMAAYFENTNLSGFANWMQVQAQEEMSHAMKFYRYINERGGRVTLKQIDAPRAEWKDAVEVVKEVYDHEQKVTSMINDLVNLSNEQKDHATTNMLQWFVAEQVEEEANADEMLQQLKLIDGKGAGILMLDRELKKRVFVDATQSGE